MYACFCKRLMSCPTLLHTLKYEEQRLFKILSCYFLRIILYWNTATLSNLIVITVLFIDINSVVHISIRFVDFIAELKE